MTDDPTHVRVGDHVVLFPRGKKRTWCADFWQDNVRRRVSLTTGDKKIAIERATKFAADLLGGTYQSPPPAADDRARRTLVKYRVTRLAQVTAGHFDRYRLERRAARHPKTVYCEGVVLKQFFK